MGQKIRMNKQLVSAVTLAVMLSTAAVPSYVRAASVDPLAQSLHIRMKQLVVPLDQEAIMEDNRVFVPLRSLNNFLGVKTDYDAKTKLISITKDDKVITCKVGSKVVVVNGTNVTLDVAPISKYQSTYVPIRFISETLGVGVSFDSKLNCVHLDDPSKTLEDVNALIDKLNADKYAKSDLGNKIKATKANSYGTVFTNLKTPSNTPEDVYIVKQSQLPVNCGDFTIMSVDSKSCKNSFTMKIRFNNQSYDSLSVQLNETAGLKRYRQTFNISKDIYGVSTLIYDKVHNKDSLFDSSYSSFNFDNLVKYLSFRNSNMDYIAVELGK